MDKSNYKFRVMLTAVKNKNVIADLIRNLIVKSVVGRILRVKPAMTNPVGANPCGRPNVGTRHATSLWLFYSNEFRY